MTIARDPHSDAPNQLRGDGERPGLIRRLRIPLLFLAACLAGFVLEFGLGLPGTPVWAGVIVAELVIGVSARMAARREPAREEPEEQDEAVDEPPAEPAPKPESARPRSLPKPPPEPPEPVRPEPAAAPLPQVPAAAPAPPPPPPAPPKRTRKRAEPKAAIEETLASAVDAAGEPAPAEPAPVELAPTEPAAETRAIAPADPDQPWLAEIVWRESGGGGAFFAVARNRAGESATVGEARVPQWPPRDGTSMDALGATVSELEAALMARGWTPAPPGRAWYARRFAWGTAAEPGPAVQRPQAPTPTPAPAPRRATPPAAAPAGEMRPAPAKEWPADTADLVRCQIAWVAAYRKSRFEAIAYTPGDEEGRTVGASDPFRWMLKDPPNWRDPKQLDAVKGLRSALLADGWEEVGDGPAWYARRFVWRGDGDPPRRIS